MTSSVARPVRFLMLVVGLVGAGAVLAPRSARAGNIVIEAHIGQRTKNSAEILAPVFDELARREYSRRYEDVGRRFETTVSAASQPGDSDPAALVDQLEGGYRLWITGKFKEGVAALQPLIEQAHRSPVLVATNSKVAAALFKGLVGLSLCHHRLGDDTAAWAAMAELLRSFDTEVTKGLFGSEAFELFAQVKRDTKEAAKGALTVHSVDGTAAIFVNERFAKVGEVVRAELIPGRYRVFAQLGKDFGRVYTVDIKPGAKAELEVDPAFERAVVTTSDWTGLLFRDKAERDQREVELAARFGTAMNAIGVVVLGIDVRNQHTVAYGALVNASTGKEIRRASVVIDTLPPPERLRALARFLTGDQAAAGIEVHEVHEVIPVPSSGSGAAGDGSRPVLRDAGGSRFGTWKWVVAGGAVAGVGVGLGLVILDGHCSTTPPVGQKCRDLYETQPAGWITLGAGAAISAVATWMWLTDHRSSPGRPSTALWLTPLQGGAFATLRLPL